MENLRANMDAIPRHAPAICTRHANASTTNMALMDDMVVEKRVDLEADGDGKTGSDSGLGCRRQCRDEQGRPTSSKLDRIRC